MNSRFPELRYLAALIAILLLLSGILFDLTGRRQRTCQELDAELEQLRAEVKKQYHLFDERDRIRQQLSMVDAEYEMMQQIARKRDGE